MDNFINVTDEGNEKAIRRGSRVPDGAINMAWVKAPKLTPDKNVVIVDTSRAVEENVIDSPVSCKIMYANALGILEDPYGNQVISDEYPAIADVFSIDEDFVTTPGSEYESEHILGYVHVSRFFHVDFPGLTLGTVPQTYRDDVLKIVDENGKDYIDDEGAPRYRIQITAAHMEVDSEEENAAYRVYAFVDTNSNENLYLTYNKIELTADGDIINQNINHREILNPQPYFIYQPEESDVADPNNRHKKWYSTKPTTLKQQVIGTPYADIDGYKVYVPKKALGDPRIFQLFRWRMACDYIDSYKIDPSRDAATIKAGVLTFGGLQSVSPYVFYNLGRSQYNASQVTFVNPLKESLQTPPAKNTRSYWTVDFNTVTYDQLKQFDILVLAPLTTWFDFAPYNAKIKYFTETLGKTLVIETHNYVQVKNFGFTLSKPVWPASGGAAIVPGPGTYGIGPTIRQTTVAKTNPIFDGDAQLGGWEINDGTPDELNSISPFKNGAYGGYGLHQYIGLAHPADYTGLLITTSQDGTSRNALMHKKAGTNGNIFISTIGVGHTPNQLYSDTTGKFLYPNREASIHTTTKYQEYIDGYSIEGAMKLFYNICLLAVKGAILDSTDEQRYSTSWTSYSPWKASWVIKGDVLFEDERDESDFVYLPKDPTILEPVWQRKLTNKTAKQLIDEQLTAADLVRVAGSTRQYRVEISNEEVEGPITIDDKTKPYAYTEAYSPPFEVPVELGPHVIKEEVIQGEYDADQYTHKSYPPKPFSVQVQANYDTTSQSLITEDVTVTARGTATEIIKTVTPLVTANTELSWTSHGAGSITPAGELFRFHAPHASGIRTWQDSNYYTSAWGPGNKMWPHFGLFGVWQYGSRGEVVAFIQEALNRFMFFGFFNSGVGGLRVDGYYGSATRTAVVNFQNTFNARYVDGIVDAETMSIIGNQILRLGGLVGRIGTDHTRFFGWVKNRMYNRNISDKSNSTVYQKRSWFSGGPSIIWELFAIKFDDPHKIHGVSLTPSTDGATRNVWWRSIDIRNLGGTALSSFMVNYNSESGKAIYMPHRPADGQKYYIPIGPYYGDTLIVGIGQDRGSGFGTSRVLGVRDLVAHAKTLTGGETIYTERSYSFTVTKTFKVTTGTEVVMQLTPTYTGKGRLANINWTSATSNNPEVAVSISSTGRLVAEHNQVVINSGDNYTKGPILPFGQTTYYISEDSKTRRTIESGWISKPDGIKLLAKADGTPIGFPSMPTAIGPNEAQRHYATLTIASLKSDPSIKVGFYDFLQKEFIFNADGKAEMSYVEYLRRGAANVYVGLISTYEVESNEPIPVTTDAPPLPYKWAMPVYGVCQKNGSRIGIEPLPNGLGPSDLWYVPIRTGKFNRLFSVRTTQDGPLTGWIRNYQGTQIRAFYAVAEADRVGWSTIYGRPNLDVKGETPDIVDDNVIQVRQPPILMIQEPTALPSHADPVRPVFDVSVRDNVGDDWRTLSKEEILDYNVSEGTIFLQQPLETTDDNLVKVDYVTSRKTYQFKTYDGQRLNLNPYPGNGGRELIGKPIYIYIVPEYCKDNTGKTISDSIETKTVRFTLDPSLFNSLDPDYNPLAIQLGIIYITSALDIDEVTILDTRRRGGGARDGVTKEDIIDLAEEAIGYWDIGHGAGQTYQKGGFIIVRLPAELKEQFPDVRDIKEAINRNITAGVQYKIEDLNGNEW